MTSDAAPPWGRAVRVPAVGRCWHRVLGTVLALDLLLPLTALAGDGLQADSWWLEPGLLVVRYGMVAGVLAFLAHGQTCNGSGLLCGGEPDNDSIGRSLLGAALGMTGAAVQLALAGTVALGVTFLDGEPMRSTYLAVAGRPVQAHVVQVRPECATNSSDNQCGRLMLAGPDGAPLGSIDAAVLEAVRGLPTPESRVSLVPSGTSPDLPVAKDPLGLIEPQPIGAGGRVAVRHPVLDALLGGEWLTTLGLLVTLLRSPRRSSRSRAAGEPEVKAPSRSTGDR
jgi:hypothetical protein